MNAESGLETVAEPPAVVAALGEQIRFARNDAGLTQDGLADKIHYTKPAISLVENGQRVPQLEMIQRMDEALGTGDRLQMLWRHVASESSVARVAELGDAERRAVSISCYEPVVVVGLLQTEKYAREILTNGRFMGGVGDEVIEERVVARMRRQEILSLPNGPIVWVILGEAAMRHDFGKPDVLRAQLEHLHKCMHAPRIKLQILPFNADAVVSAPMEIIDLGGTSMVYLEDPLIGRTISGKSRVMDYAQQLDMLRAQALSLSQSARLVEQRLEEL